MSTDSGRGSWNSALRRWVVERLAEGRAPADVVTATTAYTSVDRVVLESFVHDVLGSEAYDVAMRTVQRLRKIESTLDVLHNVREADASGNQVERRSGLTADAFLREHYAPNRPVVLTDVAMHWPARQRWTPEFFQENWGDEEVEVMADRDADPRYEINSLAHERTMQFGDFVDAVREPTNDIYLVANNALLDRPAFKALLDDIVLPAFMDPRTMFGQVFLWFGAAGSVTPLHHDVQNVLLVQVRGRKRVTLISPLQSHLVYNRVGVFSDVDVDEPDARRHPRFGRAHRHQIVLAPGEALFVPVGWWHHVVGLDMSISVSMTNFAYPNAFKWD